MKGVPNKEQSIPLLYIQQPSLKYLQPIMQSYFKKNETPMPIQPKSKKKTIKVEMKSPEKISPVEKQAKMKFVVKHALGEVSANVINQMKNLSFNDLPLPQKLTHILSLTQKTENLLFDFMTTEGNYTGTIHSINNKTIEIIQLWEKKTKAILLDTITNIEMKGVWKSGLPRR